MKVRLFWLMMLVIPALILRSECGFAAAAEESPPPKKMSLAEVIDAALTNHSDLGIARQSVFAADAARISARSPMLPQFTTTFNMLRGKSVGQQSGVNFRRVGDLNSEQGTFAINWNLDSGSNFYRYRSTAFDQKSARAGVANAANNVRLNVTNAYVENLRSKRLHELALANQRVAEAQLELVRARIKVGDAAPVDELPLRVQVENAKVQVLTALNTVRTSASALREAMGLDYGPPIDIEDLPEPTAPPAKPLEEHLDEAVRSRPDLIQTRANIGSSLNLYRAAKTAMFPTLSIMYGDQQGYGNFSSLRQQWSLQAFMSFPIWTWGREWADAKQSLTQVKRSELSVDQLRKTIASQVEQAYLSLNNASERITASHLEVEAAQQNLEAQNTKYKLGAGVTVVDVIQAQVQLNQAQTNLIQAIYDYYSAKAQLEWSIGHGQDWKNYARPLEIDRKDNQGRIISSVPAQTEQTSGRKEESRRGKRGEQRLRGSMPAGLKEVR